LSRGGVVRGGLHVPHSTKIDAKQNVLVIYLFFCDVREITFSYKNTDKPEKQIIKLIEMIKTVHHHRVIELN
jgi:hypothetical protein